MANLTSPGTMLRRRSLRGSKDHERSSGTGEEATPEQRNGGGDDQRGGEGGNRLSLQDDDGSFNGSSMRFRKAVRNMRVANTFAGGDAASRTDVSP